MATTLTIEKKQDILNLCTATKFVYTLTVSELAKIIGKIPVEAALWKTFYRQLERDKISLTEQK